MEQVFLFNVTRFSLQQRGEETDLVARLPTIWDDLVLKSKNIDANLKMVKQKFTEVRNWDDGHRLVSHHFNQLYYFVVFCSDHSDAN